MRNIEQWKTALIALWLQTGQLAVKYRYASAILFLGLVIVCIFLRFSWFSNGPQNKPHTPSQLVDPQDQPETLLKAVCAAARDQEDARLLELVDPEDRKAFRRLLEELGPARNELKTLAALVHERIGPEQAEQIRTLGGTGPALVPLREFADLHLLRFESAADDESAVVWSPTRPLRLRRRDQKWFLRASLSDSDPDTSVTLAIAELRTGLDPLRIALRHLKSEVEEGSVHAKNFQVAFDQMIILAAATVSVNEGR